MMVSVVVEKPGQMCLVESVKSEPKADEVCVKVEYAGICGSDLHIYHGANPFAVYPRIVGHEFVGTIIQVGENIDPLRIGERVVVDPVISCGHCYPCSIGRPNVCESLNVLGVHRDGGFTEYTCVPATNAYPVPEDIPANIAVTIEPCIPPLLHALTSKRPRHRYPVTFPTRLFAILRRLLPSRWLDRILAKSA